MDLVKDNDATTTTNNSDKMNSNVATSVPSVIPEFSENFRIHFDRQADPVWLYCPYRIRFVYGNLAAAKIFGNSTVQEFLNTTFKDTSMETVNWTRNFITKELFDGSTRLKPWTFYSNSTDGQPFKETCRLSVMYVERRMVLLCEVIKSETSEETDLMKMTQEGFKYSPGMISMFSPLGDPLLLNLRAEAYYDAISDTTNLKSLFLDSSVYDCLMSYVRRGEVFTMQEARVKSDRGTGHEVYHSISARQHKNPVTGKDWIIVHQLDVSEQVQRAQKVDEKQTLTLQNLKLLKSIGNGMKSRVEEVLSLCQSEVHCARNFSKIKKSAKRMKFQLKTIDTHVALIEKQQKVLKLQSFSIVELLQSLSSEYYERATAQLLGFYLNIVDQSEDDSLNDEIVGDPALLEIALRCVLENAMKFTIKGSITLSIKFKNNQNAVTITVADTGIGIASFEIDSIFNLGFQSQLSPTAERKAASGCGVGLSVVRRIAKLHGGDVKVSSSFNNGSTFVLTILQDARNQEYDDETDSSSIDSSRKVEPTNNFDKEQGVGDDKETNKICSDTIENLRKEKENLRKENEELRASACTYKATEASAVEEIQKLRAKVAELSSLHPPHKLEELLQQSRENEARLKASQRFLIKRVQELALIGIERED